MKAILPSLLLPFALLAGGVFVTPALAQFPIPIPAPPPEPEPEPEPTPTPVPAPLFDTTVSLSANESGWSASGVHDGQGYYVESVVFLSQGSPYDGTNAFVTSSDQLTLDPIAGHDGSVVSFVDSLENTWGQELPPGTWYATVEVTWYLGDAPATDPTSILLTTTTSSSQPFMVPFTNPRTPGYWKNHESVWGAQSMMIGGVNYTQAELMTVLGQPVRGDITIILMKHVIAARLNLLAGSDPVIQLQLDAADAYLMAQPLGSKPNGGDKAAGNAIKNALDAYNNL